MQWAFLRSPPGPNIDQKSCAWSNGLKLWVFVSLRALLGLSDRLSFQLLKSIGVQVELADVGEQKLPDGSKLKLPPVILGTYGSDKAKKTILIYGHLDVQPAQLSDGWDTEPFVLTEKNGKLFGRGSTDDKGPVLSWINVIEAYQKLNEPFPVNVKVMPWIESERERHSLCARRAKSQHRIFLSVCAWKHGRIRKWWPRGSIEIVEEYVSYGTSCISRFWWFDRRIWTNRVSITWSFPIVTG